MCDRERLCTCVPSILQCFIILIFLLIALIAAIFCITGLYIENVYALDQYELNVAWTITNVKLDVDACKDSRYSVAYRCLIGFAIYSWRSHNKNDSTILEQCRWTEFDIKNITHFENIMENYIGNTGEGSYNTRWGNFYPNTNKYDLTKSSKHELKLACIILSCCFAGLLLCFLVCGKYLYDLDHQLREHNDGAPLLAPSLVMVSM